MQNLLEYICVAASGYVIGSVPWAFILGRLNGIDIREHGSRNVGATNVNRVLGKKWGVSCFALDFLKGLLPILAVKALSNADMLHKPEIDVVIVASASVAGHMWPLFLKFKGGKGISTIAGIILAVAPLSLLTAGAAWLLIFHFSRYVSLASISAATLLPISAWAFSTLGWSGTAIPALTMLSVLSALAIFRHRSNIKRLLNGTENKFERKRKQ